MAQSVQSAQQQYQNSQAVKDLNQWQNATIDQLGAKYGFDFSKAYAERQAEAEAQASRNAYTNSARQNETLNQQNTRSIDDFLREGVIGNERNFFQQYQNQRQQLADRGLNAGLAAEQNLRLQMNQQHELGGLYRDAQRGRMNENDRFSNESMRIGDALALVEQQRVAQADQLYQNRLTQGHGMLGQEKDFYRTLERDAYGMMQNTIGDIRGQEQFAASQSQWAAEQQRLRDFFQTEQDRYQQNYAFDQRKFDEQMKLELDKFSFQKQQAERDAAARLAASKATSTKQATTSVNSFANLYDEFKKSTSNQGQSKSYSDLLVDHLSKNGTVSGSTGGSNLGVRNINMMKY